MKEIPLKFKISSFGHALSESLGFLDHQTPQPSFTHYLISGLPVRDVVTTNYDPLLENALRALKVSAFTISEPSDVARAPTGQFHTNVLKVRRFFFPAKILN